LAGYFFAGIGQRFYYDQLQPVLLLLNLLSSDPEMARLPV
jgi:hypothetical protein